MSDPRPPHAPMPRHLAEILDRHSPAFAEMLATVFDEALHADDGPPGMRENDALSLMSQLVASGGSVFAVQLAQQKGQPLGVAFEMAINDIAMRMRQIARLYAEKIVMDVTRGGRA
jgi:hypothetical protein